MDFKKNLERQYAQLINNRQSRFRSSVFELPEFANSLMISVVVLVKDELELERAELFIQSCIDEKDIQITILLKNGLSIQNSFRKQLDVLPLNLERDNHASSMNRVAVNLSGKIICLQSSLENFNTVRLQEIVDKIKKNDMSQICTQNTHNRMTSIAMACDVFYLTGGLDELFEDLDICFLDLALRAEMLGNEINSTIWPMPDIPSRAEKNCRKGRLKVNQESIAFSDL